MALTERQRLRREDAKLAYAAFIEFYPLSLDDLPGEIWKDIEGYGGVYQVSTFGRVKSFWKKTPRILKPYLRGDYLSVILCIDGKMKQRKIHILVAKAFIPNPLKKPEVNHRIGMKFNCHVENLEWSTRAENVQHAFASGLQVGKQGEEHPKSKLKNANIVYIRDNPDNLTQEQLAEMFGVTDGTISKIQLGETYENAGGIIREKSEPPHNYISDEIREQIRADWATGQYTQRELARKFGYNPHTISKIIREGQ